jgi:hypothetical protein
MAAEISVTIDATTGSLLVEGPDHLPRELRDAIEGLMGPARTIGCAASIDMRTLMPASDEEAARGNGVRVASYWCDSLPCPNYIEKREHLPLFQEQRSHLLELRILGTEMLPAKRNDEIASAVEALDGRIVAIGGTPGQVPAATQRDEPAMGGDQRATIEHHVRRDNRLGARPAPGAPGTVTP